MASSRLFSQETYEEELNRVIKESNETLAEDEAFREALRASLEHEKAIKNKAINPNIIKIYFMRHADRNEPIYAKGDPDITQEGLARATRNTEMFLKDKNIQLIMSSPFIRCVQTAGQAQIVLGVPLVIEVELREMWDKRLINADNKNQDGTFKDVTCFRLKNKKELMMHAPFVKLNNADYLLNFEQFENKKCPHHDQDEQISSFEINAEEVRGTDKSHIRFKQTFNQIVQYAKTYGINNLLVVCHGDMFASIVDEVSDGGKIVIETSFCCIIGVEVNKTTKQLKLIEESVHGIEIMDN